MPATTAIKTDRQLLIGCGLLFGLFTLAGMLMGPRDPDRFPPNSSYSAKKEGAKAAFLLLGEMGFSMEHWERPLADLRELQGDPGKLLLILDAPFLPTSKLGLSEEKDALNAFLARGGRVLAAGPESASILTDVTWEEPDKEKEEPVKRYAAAKESPLNWQAPSVEMRPSIYPNLQVDPGVEHYEGPVVLSYHAGKGEVIIWADSSPLTNDGLSHAGNLQLLL